ncbi:MAG TPA: ABC transporter permease [Patescibacteria group bacterium]|nr:ABC transporter permease [Patescibacteria group bacterium]
MTDPGPGMRENAKPAEVFISPTGAPMDVVHQAEGGLPPSGPEDFEVALESLNQWQIAWRRFKRHRLALIGSVIIFVMVLLAIFGPIIWPYNRLDLKPISKPGGNPPGWLQNPRTLADPFGTDNGGRSVFVLTVNGARLSMLIGLGTTVIAVTIGVIVGSFAGFFGGRVDGALMRFVDLMLTIPFLFVILVAARFFGAGDPIVLTVIFGLLFWPGLARLVRALFLSLREQDFVHAARAVGVSDVRITFRHILPNALGPIIVSATLLVASAIVTEAFVSFLNFGLKATDISWGNALANSQQYQVLGNWWWAFFPGMAIALTVTAINFMGDGLRDALDPRSKE